MVMVLLLRMLRVCLSLRGNCEIRAGGVFTGSLYFPFGEEVFARTLMR